MHVRCAVLQLILGAAFCCVTADYVVAKPNIVFIMADDLGWSDTSNSLTNLGNPSDFYETPVIDRLASEGMAFTNAYTNGPNCAPTRSAILTGQYAPRPTNNVYLVNNLDRGGSGTLLVGPSQGLPTGTDAIPTHAFTLGEMLQSANYTTSHYGKFHVTETGTSGAALITSDHGFDQNFGGTTAGNPGSYHSNGTNFAGEIGPELDLFAGNYTQQYVDNNIKPYAVNTSVAQIDALVGTNKHVSDAMADAAIQFMEQEKSGSFYVQFHPYAVHTPIGNNQARDDLLHKYQNKPDGVQDSNASFAALIEGMDQSVARLINYLETTPDPNNPGSMLDDNTIVFFFSDNGGALPQSNNGPLKGRKGEFDEGGIRVPLIAWSGNPNLVDGGTVNSTPVAGIDFYKTFAALSEAGDPTGVTLDGEDISGILADNNAVLGRDGLYWHLPGYLIGSGRDQRPQTVVRSGKWKLMYNYEDQSYELYDLDADISESTDVTDANPTVVADLGDKMLNWLDEVDAPLATLRSGQLRINATGPIYSNGAITTPDGPLTINAGEEVPYVLGGALSLADLNRDAQISLADWLMFRSGQSTDLTGMTSLEAFQKGDLDGDLDNDLTDFVLFKQAYESATGGGSFETLLSVPEPAGLSTVLTILAIRGSFPWPRSPPWAGVERSMSTARP